MYFYLLELYLMKLKSFLQAFFKHKCYYFLNNAFNFFFILYFLNLPPHPDFARQLLATYKATNFMAC